MMSPLPLRSYELEVRYPMGDNARTLLILALGLIGLGLAGLFATAGGGDALTGQIAAGLLVPIGVLMGVLGARLMRMRPREVVLTAEGVTLPAMPLWREPRVVAWSEVAGLGTALIPNVGVAMAVSLRSGDELRLPLQWLPDADEIAERIGVRVRWSETGDPDWTLPAWERLAFEGGFGLLAAPGREPHRVDSWEDWASRVGEGSVDDSMLVLGRPSPATALSIDAVAVEGLLDEVEAAMAVAGVSGRLDRRNLGMVLAKGELVLELFALLRRVQALAPAERGLALTAHFTDMLAARVESDALLVEAEDLDAVRDRLVIEVHGADRVGEIGLQRPLGGGVVAVLALDHAHGVTRVPAELCDRWGVGTEALFDQAIANHRALPVPEASEGEAFEIYSGPLASSLLLCLDVVCESPEGAVVAVPHQDELVVMGSVITLVVGGPMALFASWSHGEGHRPVSPMLYVWWKGELHPIDVRKTPDGTLALVPPPDIFGEAFAAFRAGSG